MGNRYDQESKLQRAAQLAKLSWWEYDIATRTFTLPAETYTLYGQPFCNRPLTLHEYLAFVHPEDVAKVQAVFSEATPHSHVDHDHRIIKASGEVVFITHYTEVITDATGNAVQVIGTAQDTTRQKTAETNLWSAKQKYKLLFDQSLIPKLIFHTETFRFIEVNDAAVKQYGYSREEFLNLTILDLRPPEDRPALLEAIENYRDQKEAVFASTHRHMKKNGDLFFVQIYATLIDLPTGLHSVVIANDMTEKLQMQHRIISEKVMAQREIAKAIIETQEKERQEIGKELHDNVNQILTTIKLYIENIRNYPDHYDAFIDKSVMLTQRAINEIRFLSKQLVTPVINDLNFQAAVIEMVDHYQSLNLFRIKYTFNVDEDQLDKDMQLTIYRIIQEQLNNIVKHAKASAVSIAVTNTDVLQVTISDDGIGFNTTLSASGMGLSNIKNRAEVYKGTLNVASAPGEGCTLTITFPSLHAVTA